LWLTTNSVRESLEVLIKFSGWQPETFASAGDFWSTAHNDAKLFGA